MYIDRSHMTCKPMVIGQKSHDMQVDGDWTEVT